MKLRVPVLKLKTVEVGRTKHSYEVSAKAGRPIKKLLVSLAVAVGLIAIGIFIWQGMRSPSVGQIAQTNQDNSPQPKVAEYQTLSTDFYTLNYPGRYTQQPTDLPPAGILDHKVLSYSLGGSSGNSTVTIDIKAAPDGGITQDST